MSTIWNSYNSEVQEEILRTLISISDNVDSADKHVESFLLDSEEYREYKRTNTDKEKFKFKGDFIKRVFGVQRIYRTSGETEKMTVEEKEYRVLLSTLISSRFGI